MRTSNSKYLCILIATIVCILCLPEFLHAATTNPIGLFGSWKGYFQGDEEDTTTDGLAQFRQIYDAVWNPKVTNKMNFSADLGYSNNWVDGLGTRELISPTLRFEVRNDLFSFDLNTRYLENNMSFRADVHTYSWNSILSSSWNNYLWPKISMRFGQQLEQVDSSERRAAEDTTNSYIGSSVTWEIYKFKLFYDFSWNRRDRDYLNDSTQNDVKGHLAKFEYKDNYWDNRISLNFSQLFFNNDTQYSTSGGDTLVKLALSSGRSGIDMTPTSGFLPLNQRLIDGDLTTSAVTVQLQQSVNLAVRTQFNSVDSLYVYTTRDDRLLIANTKNVTWDLYTSSDGVNWQLATANIPSSFNTTDFRFEIANGNTVRAEYMKLVVTGWIPSLDINITEVEAYSSLAADKNGDKDVNTKNYKTELYLGIIPLDNTRFNYSFSWDRSESSGINDTTRDQLIQTARLGWYYSRYFTPSTGFSSIVNTNDASGAVDTETRTYDIQVTSSPLATLDFGLSYSWSEYYEDNDRLRTINYVSFSTLAKLYPDLTTELTLGYNESRDEVNDFKSDGFSINFIMHSWLRKSLNVTLRSNYNFADSNTIIITGDHFGHGTTMALEDVSSEQGTTELIMSWRLSEILSFGLRGYTTYGNNIDTDYGSAFNVDYQVFRTSKTNMTLGYMLNISKEKDTINNFGLTWGWDISKFFTLTTSGNYIIADSGNTWNMYSQLTAKF